MTWAVIPLLAIVYGLANHARGRGTLIGGRVACAAYGGISFALAALLVGFDPERAAIAAVSNTLGFYNWLVWGWGLYFAAFTGQWKEGEKEIGWIDHFCLWVFPFVTADRHWTNYARGTLGMALRGLYLIPLFLLIDPAGEHIISSYWWLALFGPLQGAIYAANRIAGAWIKEGTAWPELITGSMIGALSGTALWMIVNQ